MAPCQDGAQFLSPSLSPSIGSRCPRLSLRCIRRCKQQQQVLHRPAGLVFACFASPLITEEGRGGDPSPASKQASKTGQQLHPTTCTNRTRLLERNGPAIPIRFRCCSAQMFQLSLVSTYSSSFFIIQFGCCCCPASSLALVFDQLVAVGELC